MPRVSGGLNDIVFEDAGFAEGAEDGDGENRDGDGSSDGEAGAKANIDGNCAENDTEEGAEDQGTSGEFGAGLGGGNEGFEGGFDGCGCCHVVRLPACSKLGFGLDGSVSAGVWWESTDSGEWAQNSMQSEADREEGFELT